MGVPTQLWQLFSVDKQLRGLTSRLDAAQQFYQTQQTQLEHIDRRREVFTSEQRQLKASLGTQENEAASVKARMEHLRTQMNSAKTAKEYQAFATELTNLKGQLSGIDDSAMELMGRLEKVEGQLRELNAERDERQKLSAGALGERDARQSEIKERVDELRAKRAELAGEVPADSLRMFEQLVAKMGDMAMCEVEVIDRRSHEYSCGSCYMAVPVEAVSALLSRKLTQCPSCRAILYVNEEQRDGAMGNGKGTGSKGGGKGKRSKQAAEA